MELAIINGTYREPNVFQKKLQQLQFPNNRMPIGAPLILTPRMQQNLLAAQLQQGSAQAMFTTAANGPGQPTLTAVPQGSLIQTTSANGEPNFVQVFAPLQTLDQMGGMIASGAQLFEYPAQIDPSQASKKKENQFGGFFASLKKSIHLFSFSIPHCRYSHNTSRYQIEFSLSLVVRSSVDLTHLLLLPRQTSAAAAALPSEFPTSSSSAIQSASTSKNS